MEKCLDEKNFSKGDIIFSEGSTCERIFIVQSGRVKLFRTASSGREQILEMLGPGDTCACNPGSAEWFCTSTAQAATPAKVWFLVREAYTRLVRNNAKMSRALNELFANRLRCFSSLIEEVSLKDTKKRLIKFLLDMLQTKKFQAAKNDALFVPFTREELAHRIGAARETVARHLNELKRESLIDLKPHQIILRDPKGLEKLME